MPPTHQQALLLLNVSNEIYASPGHYAFNKSTEIPLAIETILNTAIITTTVDSISANGNYTPNTTHLGLIEGCSTSSDTEELYWSYFGTQLAVPEWEAILTTIVLSIIIVLTIIGNVLVILSVFTYKPLRIVQNFFIVSLAVADLTVALLVLPFNVAYSILGRWEFGIHVCKMWLTCDVLCCTSSILNLCAIALDRYWAITDPINYAQKRTVGRVLLLIAGVWILSLLISSPPLVGWNDWPDEFTSATPCELTSNRGYVIYSSLGSFFIPLAIMTIVYIEIYIATRRRLRERAKAPKINTLAMQGGAPTLTHVNTRRESFALASMCLNILSCGKSSTESTSSVIIPNDQDSISSETNINNETLTRTNGQDMKKSKSAVVAPHKKTRRSKIKDSIKHGKMRVRKQQQKMGSKSKEDEKPGSTGQIVTEQLLLMVADNKDLENCEIAADNSEQRATSESTGGPNDVNHDENTSFKITPPQSSAGATSTAAMSLQKKTTGVYQFIEEKQKISLSKERRAARTLGIIMGVFVICWLPFFLMYVILPFCDTCCPTNKFKNFITWLGYINSGLNPVIYTIFNLDYRRAFKRLLGFQ